MHAETVLDAPTWLERHLLTLGVALELQTQKRCQMGVACHDLFVRCSRSLIQHLFPVSELQAPGLQALSAGLTLVCVLLWLHTPVVVLHRNKSLQTWESRVRWHCRWKQRGQGMQVRRFTFE